MTPHPDEQARERFEAWWWKRHPDYTSELLKRTSKSGAYDSDWVNGMWLAWKAAGQEARLAEAEWWHTRVAMAYMCDEQEMKTETRGRIDELKRQAARERP